MSAEVNFDALEVVPPTYHDHRGVLQGEMHDYRTCSVKGKLCAEYAAYFRTCLRYFGGAYLTIYEFRQA